MHETPDPERINEIFNDALELPAVERVPFVERSCPDEPLVRAEVLSLLAKQSQARQWLPDPTSTISLAPAFRSGDLICNRYLVVRLLGRGGMGEVYEAEDREMGDHVALKTIRREIASGEGILARFRQEIQLGRKIAHPNACHIYTIDKHDSTYFFSMELLRGDTLAARLKAIGRFTTSDALPLLQQMAEALSAAHDAGIIHRDFKPGNVMLCEGDPRRRAVITDFGLARLVQPAAGGSITGLAQFAGTPAYMAPEQIEDGPLSPATDIYALGLVAYEMITGQRPFEGTSDMSAAFRRMTENPTPISKYLPNVDPRWNAAILRCLERNPAARWPSAREFVAALTGTLPSNLSLPGRALSRIPGKLWLWAALPVGILLGALALWFWRPLPTHSPEALYWLNRGTAAVRDGVYWNAINALNKAIEIDREMPLAYARRAEAWNEMKAPDRAAADVTKAYAHSSRLSRQERAYIQAINATIAGEFADAVARYRVIAAKLPDSEKQIGLLDLGRAYEKNAEPLKALDAYKTATTERPSLASPWLRRGVLETRLYGSTQARASLETALDSYRRMGDTEGQVQATIELARVSKISEQKPLLDQAFRFTGENWYQQIEIRLQQSFVAGRDGAPQESERLAKDAKNIAEAQSMPVLSAWCLNEVGNSMFQSGRRVEAEKDFRESIALASSYSAERQAFAARINLADLLQSSPDARERLQGESLAKHARDYYQSHGDRAKAAKAEQVLAEYEMDRGDYQQSADTLNRAKATTNDPVIIADVNYELGMVDANAGDFPGELKHLQVARDLHESLGRRSDMAYDDDALALGQANLGDIQIAVSSFAKALQEGSSPSDLALDEADLNLIKGDCATAEQLAAAVLKRTDAEPADLAEGRRITGLCELRLGRVASGRRLCEEAAKTPVQNRAVNGNARLAFAWAQIASKDSAGALDTLSQLRTDLEHDGRRSSLWRCEMYQAIAFALKGDQSHSTASLNDARLTLRSLQREWGTPVCEKYLSRADVRADLISAQKQLRVQIL